MNSHKPIKKIREALGKTQVEMASLLGMHQGSYSNLEKKGKISGSIKQILINVLNVNPLYLEDPDKTPDIFTAQTGTITDRIGLLCDYFGMTLQELFGKASLDIHQKVYLAEAIKTGKPGKVDNAIIDKVLSAFPVVNPRWVYDNEKPMLRSGVLIEDNMDAGQNVSLLQVKIAELKEQVNSLVNNSKIAEQTIGALQNQIVLHKEQIASLKEVIEEKEKRLKLLKG